MCVVHEHVGQPDKRCRLGRRVCTVVSRDRAGQGGGKPPSLGQQPAQAGVVKSELTAFLAERLLGGWTNRGRKCEVGPHQGQEQLAHIVEQGRGHQFIATERLKPLGDPIGGASHGLGVASAAEQECLELGLPREGHRRERGDRVSDLFGREKGHRSRDAGNRSVAATLCGAENRDRQAEVALDDAGQVRAAERPGKACGFERSLERWSERGDEVELGERLPCFARLAYGPGRPGCRLRSGRLVRAESSPLPRDIPTRDHCRKGVDRVWIESRTTLADDVLNRPLGADPATVRPVAGDRDERVTDGDDATGQRNRLASKAVRVAVAVPSLMMGSDQRRRVGHRREGQQQFRTKLGMAVQQRPVLRGQRAGLEHHRIRQLDHPDVADLGTDVDRHSLGAAEAELAAHLGGELAHQRRAGVLGRGSRAEGRLPRLRDGGDGGRVARAVRRHVGERGHLDCH